MKSTYDLLDEAVRSELEDFLDCPNIEEKYKRVSLIDTLYSMLEKELKRSDDFEKSELERNLDFREKNLDRKEKKLDRYCRVGMSVVEIGVPLIFYGIWMNKGFKFEETGVYTSNTFRNLFSKFRATK